MSPCKGIHAIPTNTPVARAERIGNQYRHSLPEGAVSGNGRRLAVAAHALDKADDLSRHRQQRDHDQARDYKPPVRGRRHRDGRIRHVEQELRNGAPPYAGLPAGRR